MEDQHANYIPRVCVCVCDTVRVRVRQRACAAGLQACLGQQDAARHGSEEQTVDEDGACVIMT